MNELQIFELAVIDAYSSYLTTKLSYEKLTSKKTPLYINLPKEAEKIINIDSSEISGEDLSSEDFASGG